MDASASSSDLKIIGVLSNPRDKQNWDEDFDIREDDSLALPNENPGPSIAKNFSKSKDLNLSVGSFSLNLEENDVNPSPKEVKEHDSDEDWDAELEIDPSERFSTIQTGLLDRKIIDLEPASFQNLLGEQTVSVIKLSKSSRLFSLKSEQLSEPAFVDWTKNLVSKYTKRIKEDAFVQSSYQEMCEKTSGWSKFTVPWIQATLKHFTEMVLAANFERANDALLDFVSELHTLTNPELSHLPSKGVEIGNCLLNFLLIYGYFLNDDSNQTLKKIISNLKRIFGSQPLKVDCLRLVVSGHMELRNHSRSSWECIRELLGIHLQAKSMKKSNEINLEQKELSLNSLLAVHLMMMGKSPLSFDQYGEALNVSEATVEFDDEMAHLLNRESRLEAFQAEYENIGVGILKSKLAFVIALHQFEMEDGPNLDLAEELAFESCFICDISDTEATHYPGPLHEFFYHLAILFGNILCSKGKLDYAANMYKAAIESRKSRGLESINIQDFVKVAELSRLEKNYEVSVYFYDQIYQEYCKHSCKDDIIPTSIILADVLIGCGKFRMAEDILSTVLERNSEGNCDKSSDALLLKVRKKLIEIYLLVSDIDNAISMIHSSILEFKMGPSQSKLFCMLLIKSFRKKRWISDCLILIDYALHDKNSNNNSCTFPFFESIMEKLGKIFGSSPLRDFCDDEEIFLLSYEKSKCLYLLGNVDIALRELDILLTESAYSQLRTLAKLHILKGKVLRLKFNSGFMHPKLGNCIGEALSSFEQASICIGSTSSSILEAKSHLLMGQTLVDALKAMSLHNSSEFLSHVNLKNEEDLQSSIKSHLSLALDYFSKVGQLLPIIDCLVTICQLFAMTGDRQSFWLFWTHARNLIFDFTMNNNEFIFKRRDFCLWIYRMYPILEKMLLLMGSEMFGKEEISSHIVIVDMVIQSQILMADLKSSFFPSDCGLGEANSDLSYSKNPSYSISGSMSQSHSLASSVNFSSTKSTTASRKLPTVLDVFELENEKSQVSESQAESSAMQNSETLIESIRELLLILKISKNEFVKGEITSDQLLEKSKPSLLKLKSISEEIRSGHDTLSSKSVEFGNQLVSSYDDCKKMKPQMDSMLILVDASFHRVVVDAEIGKVELESKICDKFQIHVQIGEDNSCRATIMRNAWSGYEHLKAFLVSILDDEFPGDSNTLFEIAETKGEFHYQLCNLIDQGDPKKDKCDRFKLNRVDHNTFSIIPVFGRDIGDEETKLDGEEQVNYLISLIKGGRETTDGVFQMIDRSQLEILLDNGVLKVIKAVQKKMQSKEELNIDPVKVSSKQGLLSVRMRRDEFAKFKDSNLYMRLVLSPSFYSFPWEYLFSKCVIRSPFVFPSPKLPPALKKSSNYEIVVFAYSNFVDNDVFKDEMKRKELLANSLIQSMGLNINPQTDSPITGIQKFPFHSPLFRKDQKISYYRKKYKSIFIYEITDTRFGLDLTNILSATCAYPILAFTIADLSECNNAVIKAFLNCDQPLGAIFISGSHFKQGMTKLIELKDEWKKSKTSGKPISVQERIDFFRDAAHTLQSFVPCFFFTNE